MQQHNCQERVSTATCVLARIHLHGGCGLEGRKRAMIDRQTGAFRAAQRARRTLEPRPKPRITVPAMRHTGSNGMVPATASVKGGSPNTSGWKSSREGSTWQLPVHPQGAAASACQLTDPELCQERAGLQLIMLHCVPLSEASNWAPQEMLGISSMLFVPLNLPKTPDVFPSGSHHHSAEQGG